MKKEMPIPVLSQNSNLFPNTKSFYFLEPTQKKDSYELYFTSQHNENEFVHLIAVIYNYEIAKVIMNSLNKSLESK